MAIRKFPKLNRLVWSSTKTQNWDTQVQRSGSGKVRTMTNQLYPNWVIETKFTMLTDAEYRELLGFVALVKGAFEPFLWLDPEDNAEKGVVLPLVLPGQYQPIRRWGAYLEPVEYVENITVYVDGVKQTTGYSYENGLIKFTKAPISTAKVTADYTYYWKVMFKDNGLGVEHVFKSIHRSKSFKLEVVR